MKGHFYLMLHLTQFIYAFYGIEHMVKDHSDSKRGIMLTSLHSLSFQLAIRDILHPTNSILHTMASVTQVVKHWL